MSITKISAAMTDLDGAVTINESSGDADFRIESDNLENALFVQGSDGRVGLNTNSPAYGLLDVRQTGTGAQDRCLWLDMAPASSGSNNNAMVINVGNANMTNTVMRIHHESPAANQKLLSLDTTGSNTEKFWVDEDGDALLTGGLFLGGSADANKISDYEQGSWTPTLESYQENTLNVSYTSYGAYTKIGRQVTAILYITNITFNSGTNTDYIQITMPFTEAGGTSIASNSYGAGTITTDGINFTHKHSAPSFITTTKIGFLGSDQDGGAWAWEPWSAAPTSGTGSIRAQITYFTNQ